MPERMPESWTRDRALAAARGVLYTRVLPDGRVLDVVPLIMGTAQLTVSRDLAAQGWEDGF